MNVTLFVVSDGMVVDARSNNVSIFTLLEEITAPAFPILIPRVTITALLQRDANEPDAVFQLRASMGETTLFETPMGAEFQGRLRTRSILEIGGLAIPGPGPIEFRLIHNTRTLSSWSVLVHRGGIEQQELLLAGGSPVAGTAPQQTVTGHDPNATPTRHG
jgi:hypothetical protein